MSRLPDPRRYGREKKHPLNLLASGPSVDITELRSATGRLITVASDLEAVLGAGVTREATVRLWHAVDAWLNVPHGDQDLATQLFALPILFVTGGATGIVAGVIPDAGALTIVLKSKQALGPLKQFALGNTLCDASALTGEALFQLRQRSRRSDATAPIERPDVPPMAIRVDTPDEAIHLRFLIGVAVSAMQVPMVIETAGPVGAWGMEFARELSAQLCPSGMSLLAIPRAPASLLWARQRGHFACEELRLTLELSRVLRNIRASVGEPNVVIMSCENATVRVALTSPFDPQFDQQLSWALHPLDDLGQIEQSIESLLVECRVANFTWMDTVHDPQGRLAPTRQRDERK